jgi:ATP-dependent Clp protease adaptor protein ClpS
VPNRCKILQNAQIVGLDWEGSRLYDALRPCIGADANVIADGDAMTRFAPVPTRQIPAATVVAGEPPRMADDKRKSGEGGLGTAVITKTKPQTKKPSMYRVLILNDDYTPMEFVVHVIERFFGKDHEAATRIMLHVHHHGIGECGIYTYEVAETKVTQVMDFARKHQHPLQCVMEKK